MYDDTLATTFGVMWEVFCKTPLLQLCSSLKYTDP